MLFAFFLRGRLTPAGLILLPIVLAPTMFNETKASLFLVPVALVAVVVVGATKNRWRKFMVASMSVAVFRAAFVPIYDYFMKPRYGYGIVEFFTMEGRVENYLTRDVEVGSYEAVGKVDAHPRPAARVVARSITPRIRPRYRQRFGLRAGRRFLRRTFSALRALRAVRTSRCCSGKQELLGTGLVLGLLAMLFIDAFHVSRGDDFMAALALGMMGVVAVIALSLPYSTVMDSGALSYLFWYATGLVAAERSRALVREPRRSASGRTASGLSGGPSSTLHAAAFLVSPSL